MADHTYRWTKVWATQTSDDDPVQAGDIITIEAGGGDSAQQVQSVTTLWNRSGKPYKVLLTTEVK